jgi:hypothetical protein
MGYLNAVTGQPLTLLLVVRGHGGDLVAVSDARYQLRDSAGTIIRPFPVSGTDFTELAAGVYSVTTAAPSSPDVYTAEYEATVYGTLLQGEPDVISVEPPGVTLQDLVSGVPSGVVS